MLAGDASRDFTLASGSVVVGSASTCDIVVDDRRVASSHIRIDQVGGRVELVELAAAGGTFVNGERVTRAVLEAGDFVVAGSTAFRFERGTSGGPASALSSPDAALSVRVGHASQAYVVVVEPGRSRRIDLDRESVVIGGGEEADVVLSSARAERRHALIVHEGEGFTIRDLDTTAGTYVGGRRVETHQLRHGDTIRIDQSLLTFSEGFLAGQLEEVDDARARRPVVFLPGFMGSELWRGSERIWPNLRTLLLEPENAVLPDAGDMEARSILKEVVLVPNVIELDAYNRASQFLQHALGYTVGVDLLEFAYDWRQDCRESARRLAVAIDEWRTQSAAAREPLTIVAHSLGCLVARYYAERLGGATAVDRLILLGGPHQGVPKAVKTLLEGPGLLPLERADDRIGDVLATFPSLYQILPTYTCVSIGSGSLVSCLQDESWLPEARRPLLRDARAFRAELGRATSVPTVCIFGYGIDTPARIEVTRGEGSTWKVRHTIQQDGDDSIPETSAFIGGCEIHPVEQHHGSLFTDNDVKMRLKLELAIGGPR